MSICQVAAHALLHVLAVLFRLDRCPAACDQQGRQICSLQAYRGRSFRQVLTCYPGMLAVPWRRTRLMLVAGPSSKAGARWFQPPAIVPRQDPHRGSGHCPMPRASPAHRRLLPLLQAVVPTAAALGLNRRPDGHLFELSSGVFPPCAALPCSHRATHDQNHAADGSGARSQRRLPSAQTPSPPALLNQPSRRASGSSADGQQTC